MKITKGKETIVVSEQEKENLTNLRANVQRMFLTAEDDGDVEDVLDDLGDALDAFIDIVETSNC